MEDSFIIKQNLTLFEFYRSTLIFFSQSKLFKKLLILFSLSTAFMLYINIIANPELHFYDIVGALSPFIFLFIALPLIILLYSIFLFRTKSYLFKNVTYEFTHWGITRNGEKTEFSKPWRDVKKIKETKSFILFIFHNDFHVIQKRMLKNPEELNAFKEYIKENIKK